MQIDLKRLYVTPIVMSIIFTIHISISFVGVEMQTASYMSLMIQLAAFLFSVVLIIREKSLSTFIIAILLLMMFIELVSLSTNLAWKDWMYYTFDIMLLLFLFHYYRNNIKLIITGATIGLSICVYLQFFQCVTHPELWMIELGKEKAGYILGGNYNSIGSRLICALATGFMAIKLNKWWCLNFVVLTLTSIALMAMVQSMTTFTCLFIFLFLCFLPDIKLQRYAIFATIVVAVCFQVFVCFQGKGFENNDLARWFLVDILGKDITFTNRTTLWDAALRVIGKSPIWGYGNTDEKWFLSEMSSAAIGPHNFILGLLINGGVIALVLYIFIALKAFVRTLPYKERFANVTIAAPATLSIMMLMEYYPIHFPLYLLSLCYYYTEFRNSVTGYHNKNLSIPTSK